MPRLPRRTPSPSALHPALIRQALLGIALLGMTQAGRAQIITDGTLGAAGALQGPAYQIPASLGKKFGPNLFHSFAEFQLNNATESANFTGPASVRNIISRVTGGNFSLINGELKSSIAGANFFFINPSGIVFGPTAQVNVSGAFVASTADSVGLAKGGIFNALDPSPSASILTSAPVGAFGFLTPNPNPIILSGAQIIGAPGRSVSLVGGNIALETGATLGSNGGINLVSVGTPDAGGQGVVSYYSINKPTRDVATKGFSSLGDISISGNSEVDAVGAGVRVRAANLSLDKGTLLVFNDGSQPGLAQDASVRLTGLLLLKHQSNLQSTTLDASQGPPISIRADNIFLFDNSQILSNATGVGQGGDMALKANVIQMFSGSQISSDTQGSGRGGTININVGSGTLDFQETDSTIISTTSESSGQAGDLVIRAKNITLQGARLVSSATGSGAGGAIILTADALVANGVNQAQGYILSSASNAAQGGDIRIKVRNLSINNTGSINTDALGSGKGGDLTIQAKNINVASGGIVSSSTGAGAGGALNITADNIAVDGQNTGQSAIFSDATGAGRGGDIQIKAGSLRLTNTGIVNTEASGSQQGGDVTIQAKNIYVTRGGIISDSNGSGAGGALNITADTIGLDGQDTAQRNIVSESNGAGRGGNIQINTGDLRLVRGGSIVSDVSGGSVGGSVNVNASRTISLDSAGNTDNPSVIAALSGINGQGLVGTGTGGSITLQAKNLQTSGSGLIFTNNIGKGTTNDITVQADSVVLDGRGSITGGIASRLLSPDTGSGGNITINAGDVQIKNGAKVSTQTISSSKGGDIRVRADKVTLSDQGEITASTSGDGDGGNITVSAPDITLDGDNSGNSVATQTAISAVSTVNGGKGNGGVIDINTQNLQLLGHVRIDSSTASAGDAGKIIIKARNILMDSQGDNENAINTGSGDADNPSKVTGHSGTISITTDTLDMKGNATLVAATLGKGQVKDAQGKPVTAIDITAKNIVIDAAGKADVNSNNISTETKGTLANGDSDSGAIHIATDTLQLKNQALVSSSAIGLANGGAINIEARNIQINNGSVIGGVTAGEGTGGNINIVATGDVLIDGQGKSTGITTTTLSTGANLNGDKGAGGTITIDADRVGMINNAAITSGASNASSGVESSTGNGGTIKITANEMGIDNSLISAESRGTGDAGNVTLSICDNLALNRSDVSALSQQKNGGNILIETGRRIFARNSNIVAFALGNGGNVTIQPRLECGPLHSVILDHTGIAGSAVNGNGGNIEITSQIFLPSSDSIIDASSQFGTNGSVTINSPNTNVGGSLVILPSSLLDAESYLGASCAVRGVGDSSSFNVQPQNGVPTQPGDLLPSAANPDVTSGTASTDAPFSSALRKWKNRKLTR